VNFTEDTATDAVVASLSATPDPRTKAVLEALVRHVHDFVREVEPSAAEWERAIGFLTAVGQKSDDTRQEFVMLSDVLGVSMLIEAVNARRAGQAGVDTAEVTASTVLGPFHVVTSPVRALGDDLFPPGSAPACVVSGTVTDPGGTLVAGAAVDVWQCDGAGRYDVQQTDGRPPGDGRGLFHTDEAGGFWFRTVVPSHYPIPTDGPVGDLLRATGRHPYRPAHIHLLVTAPGFVPLTTHLFVADSPYIDSDAVFAVNEALVRDFALVDDPAQAAHHGVTTPFRLAGADIVLRPALCERDA
jgi:hydroxyquinol 1,2-dioxygenase